MQRLAFTLMAALPWVAAAGVKRPPKRAAAIDVASWPRMRADKFGCMLERAFGQRDAKFNCGLRHFESAGDPCKNPDAYHAGPAFPDAAVSRIDPDLAHVELSWEHGELQAVTFEFKKPLTRAQALARLHLPSKLPENITSADVQECKKGASCLTLEGFEHMGAGDVDCGDD